MPIFQYNKLVRNNIPAFHDEAGHEIVVSRLSGQALSDALVKKIHEESDEIGAALTHDELVEEIADVQQVIDDLCAVHSIEKSQLHQVMQGKEARKGGFSDGVYIETVTIEDESDEWVAYYRRLPEKYPEIN